METAELKTELLDKIEHADEVQIKELYGLFINYLNGNETIEEWGTLSVLQRNRIEESLKQADAGLGIPASEAIRKAKAKYGL